MAKYNQTRVIARMAEVAKEYGMSFNDVVKGFADDGIGFTAMCDTLGFSDYTMMPWRDLFPKQAKRVKIERPWARDLVINKAVKVEGLRLAEIAEKHNMPYETLRQRYHRLKPNTIAELIAPYKRKQPKGTTHQWRNFNFRSKK
jgi:hypothetical protein